MVDNPRKLSPSGSLSGLIGVADTVRESVEELAKLGEYNMTDEGVHLLDEWQEVYDLPPGNVRRNTIGGKLADFKIRALKIIAQKKTWP